MTIRVKLMGSDGQIREGDEALLEPWHSGNYSRLWLDIEGEISPAMHSELLRLGCHKVAITDIERTRQPPKVHQFEQNTFILFRGIIQLDEYLVLQPQQIGFFVAEKPPRDYPPGRIPEHQQGLGRIADRASSLDPGRLALQVMDYASDRYLQKILEFEARLGETGRKPAAQALGQRHDGAGRLPL